MLSANRVYLRLMEEKDIPYKVKWINDPEVRRTLNFDYPISEIGTKHWLNKVAQDSSRKDLIVCLKENDLQIGYAGFVSIDIKNSKAEIYAGIGNKDWWAKGLAQEIRRMQLYYGFYELGLNKIYTFNWIENKKIVHINKKLGFKIEGKLRKDIFSHGEYRDRYIMSILKENFDKLNY